MHRTDNPDFSPHVCAITGNSEDRVGFLDTGVTLPGFEPRIYVSHEAAKQIAAGFDFPTRDEYEELRAERDELEMQLAEALGKLNDLEEFKRAVHVIKAREDYTVSRKPGRPPKAAAA